MGVSGGSVVGHCWVSSGSVLNRPVLRGGGEGGGRPPLDFVTVKILETSKK